MIIKNTTTDFLPGINTGNMSTDYILLNKSQFIRDDYLFTKAETTSGFIYKFLPARCGSVVNVAMRLAGYIDPSATHIVTGVSPTITIRFYQLMEDEPDFTNGYQVYDSGPIAISTDPAAKDNSLTTIALNYASLLLIELETSNLILHRTDDNVGEIDAINYYIGIHTVGSL